MDKQQETVPGKNHSQPVAVETAQYHRWRTTSALYGAIAVGSVVGSVLRWLAARGVHAVFGDALPWGTLFVNVTGSFAIGLYAALTGPDGRLLVSPLTRQFVMTGVCGGYTTFSIFSLETLQLVQSAAMDKAGFNIGISITAWLAAVWLGDAIGTQMNRLKGG